VGTIARSQAYTVTDTLILQGALHFEVKDPAGLTEGIVLHHWESGFSSRIKEVTGNTVRLEREQFLNALTDHAPSAPWSFL